jgi:hypothetical protein
MPVRPGLIAAVTWHGGEVVSDDAWAALEERAYRGDTPRFANHQSFIEWFDARQAALGWEQPGFDDSGWPRARVISKDRLAPWGEPSPRPIPDLTLIPHSPCRIVETGRSIPRHDPDDPVKLANTLQEAMREPADLVAASPGGLFPVTMTAPPDPAQAAYAVFDFAENSSGYLVFSVRGTPGTVVDVGYSEDFEEGRVRCNLQGIRYSDRFILAGGLLEHQLMLPKTLRYLLVEVRRGRAMFEAIRQDVSTYPVSWQGAFVCRERPELAQVWRIGAHTVQVCMEDVYMDTPRRERASWLGDMIPEAMAAYYAFGDYALARHSLDLFMRSQRPAGWVVGRFPSLDGPNMPTWSASYAPGLADYVRFSGDVAFAGQAWDGLTRLTAWFEGQRLADDLIVVRPTRRSQSDAEHGHGYVIADWAPTRLDGAVAVMNMYYCHYLRESAFLARLLGREVEAARLDDLARRTAAAIQGLLFDAERGIFVNCRADGALSRQAGLQENLLALLWDIATPAQAWRIVEAVLPDDRPLPVWRERYRDWLALSDGTQPWDPQKMVPVGSPFFMYYALAALFEIGRAEAALNTIHEHYGGLLARGETTVWEDWSGDTSRSHGWGAGPTAHAGRYLLGVEPVTPGFQSFRVLPSFGDLGEASGRVPTPLGIVDVAWRRDAAGAVLSLTVPQGARALAGLPAATGATMLCDGQSCAPQRVVLRRGAYLACPVGPGRHELRLSAPSC